MASPAHPSPDDPPAQPLRPGVRADRGLCVGAGVCARIAPAVFDQDEEEGLVVVLDGHPEDAAAEAARRAVEGCPSGALSIGAGDGEEEGGPRVGG